MRHWTEEADDDADEPLVRPYTITGGRTTAGRDDLNLITLITLRTAAGPDVMSDRHALQPEHRTVLRLCARQPVAVAEIAAELNLPVSVTKILIGDLIDAGRVRSRPPLAFAHNALPDMTLLEAVRNGLRRL
jgi:DNA-directed RNA polymerase specialized sigma24 family protein